MTVTLSLKDFGKNLLETEDLDPVYVMLAKQNFSRRELAKWIVAYSCFYHAGVATFLSQSRRFWEDFENGLPNFPRGAERRHFRGNDAHKALSVLRTKSPREIVKDWYSEPVFSKIVIKVKSYYLFGDWIAFKLADMCDRVWGVPVDFSECYLGIYKEPLQGALLASKLLHLNTENIEEIVTHLVHLFRKYKSPPLYDRRVNVQEIETILCKYKSHYNGHYPLGKDSRELLHSLNEWGEMAKSMKRYVPGGSHV